MAKPNPYSVKNFTFDALEGKGEVIFEDGERFHFTRRPLRKGGYKWRLLSPGYKILVQSPPRMAALVQAVGEPSPVLVAPKSARIPLSIRIHGVQPNTLVEGHCFDLHRDFVGQSDELGRVTLREVVA